MGSVIYRDHERDRYDESRTTISSARRGDDRGGYTTVKRYVVNGGDDNRSSYSGRGGVRPERVEETRIVRHEVNVEEPPRGYERREDPRLSERELVIRRDRVAEEPRRDYGRRDDRTEERELVIRRTTEREEPSRERELTISRYDDRRDDRFDLDIQRRDWGDRDLQKYNRTTEYFTPAPQPQTIVIRNEIVMPRNDDFDSRRSEVNDEKSVEKREPSRGREEEFFYEKKVKERIDEPPRRDADHYDDRRSRREISPHDSVSQVGRRDRGYSSDDSMVYVRKEKVTEDAGYDGSRSPHHKRHIVEGVVAGIGAAEILRHHKQKEGRETSGGLGRVGRDVGAGALGALAAEGISRARSLHRERSKSRRRSRSDSGGRRSRSRGGSRGRDRSRSESPSRTKKLATLGLGAAAIAAAAIYAQNRKKNQSQSPNGEGRSRSRRRASSVGADSQVDDARNPGHRHKRALEAGAAGAVLAGLIERQRSKSRGGRDRSRSRVRQALPVIAAGLGSAGIAALYEKNKAKKETENAARQEREERRASRSRSRSHSRGRGRSADPYYDGPRGATASDPNLIEYGEGNVYGNNYGADYYGQPPAGEAYYNNRQNAVVPVVAGAGAYGASREVRPARSRSLSSQSSTDDGGRRRRRHRKNRGSRSRSAGKETAAAIGGVAAASEYERRKQEKRDKKARRRQEQQGVYAPDPYEDQYNPQQQPYTPTPPPANDPYAAQTGFYPQGGQFPPPPGAAPPQFQPQQPAAAYAPGATYNPNDFPPPPGAAPPQPYNANFASGGNADPYAPRRDENVSAAPTFGNPFQNQNHSVPDGLNAPRSISPMVPPPLINIQQPSMSSASTTRRSNPFLPVPDPFNSSLFTPPPYSASASRSTSQPPAHRKSVAFADAPAVAGTRSTTTIASSQQSGLHRHADQNRGYEAGDDTDSTIDGRTRGPARSQTLPEVIANGASGFASASLGPNTHNNKKGHHHRRRSADPTAPSTSAAGPSDPPITSSRAPEPPVSPAPSDQTIDLPERFDKHGRKKPEPGDDPLADRLDKILAGKGATGKLFGNFVDGLFGPEGRKKGGKGK